MENFHGLFEDVFQNASSDIEESVLDFPKGRGLSKDIWNKVEGTYRPNKETMKKARKIIDWAIKEFSLKNANARIVGSICSNTFNDSSDIDIHISADNVDEKDSIEFNKKMISSFKRKFVGKESGRIGKHPFEVYAQPNINQDIMSVGCYDLDNEKWLSGPEILDDGFNPYEKYYDGIQKHLDDISDEIRRQVFICGELASVIQKISKNVSKDDKFLKKIGKKLEDEMKNARKLFEDVRQKRSIASSPRSESEAKKKRVSKEWKIADSSFKYLDKLGYIATILSIAKVGEDDGLSIAEKAEKVISEIHSNLFNKDRTGYADVNKD